MHHTDTYGYWETSSLNKSSLQTDKNFSPSFTKIISILNDLFGEKSGPSCNTFTKDMFSLTDHIDEESRRDAVDDLVEDILETFEVENLEGIREVIQDLENKHFNNCNSSKDYHKTFHNSRKHLRKLRLTRKSQSYNPSFQRMAFLNFSENESKSQVAGQIERSASPFASSMPDETLSCSPSNTILPTDIVIILQQIRRQLETNKSLKIGVKFELFIQDLDKLLIKMETEASAGTSCDLWKLINEIWSKINNMKKELRKGTKSETFCIKIGEIFENNLDEGMRRLGHCCAILRVFKPRPIKCPGNTDCFIREGDKYYNFESWLSYCSKCFHKFDNKIPICDYNEDGTVKERFAKKSMFVSLIHHSESERFVECVTCGRRNHVICELYFGEPEMYKCYNCRDKDGKDPHLRPRAKELPTTKLSTFIQTRVQQYLIASELNMTIHIRMVSSRKKYVKVQPKTLEHFKNMPPSLPYTEKIICAFLETDDADVLFFGFHAHEYGNDCPSPNTGNIYIVNLDSVRFIEPTKNRTAIYQEIVLGYFNHAKHIGFKYIHICVKPVPWFDSDILVHAHPPEQKLPDLVRLENWYRSLFEKGRHTIVLDVQEITAFANDLQSPSELPYLDESPWPDIIEELLKTTRELENKVVLAKLLQNLTPDFGRRIRKKAASLEDQSKSYVICLNMSEQKLQDDPDILLRCKFVENREKFLELSRKHKFEFSSLRLAKYSTTFFLANTISRSNRDSINLSLEANQDYQINFGACSHEKLNENNEPFLENTENLEDTELNESDSDDNLLNSHYVINRTFNEMVVGNLANRVLNITSEELNLLKMDRTSQKDSRFSIKTRHDIYNVLHTLYHEKRKFLHSDHMVIFMVAKFGSVDGKNYTCMFCDPIFKTDQASSYLAHFNQLHAVMPTKSFDCPDSNCDHRETYPFGAYKHALKCCPTKYKPVGMWDGISWELLDCFREYIGNTDKDNIHWHVIQPTKSDFPNEFYKNILPPWIGNQFEYKIKPSRWNIVGDFISSNMEKYAYGLFED